MNVLEALVRLRDDLKLWVTNNLQALREEVDSKSTFSGDYNDLTNKPSNHVTTESLTESLEEYSYNKTYIDTELNKKADIKHGTHLTLGTGSENAFRGDYGNTAYTHSQAAHAPSNAQKNSDITKAEIEAKLTGTISSHTHAAATTSANGLMSSTDKSKLDGIAENANNYTHPSTHEATMITQDATHRFVTDTEKSTWDAKSNLTLGTTSTTAAAGNHTHNYAGSSSVGGAATSANKVNTNIIVKLNGGTTEGTDLFTFNGSTAKTINITPSAIGAASISDIPDPTETITNEIIDSAFSSVGL